MCSTSSVTTVGVGVGRFQVDELHAGHRYVLDAIHERHPNTMCVVVGSTGGLPTPTDPLPYSAVEAMIKEAYPDATVIEQFDHPLSSDSWSIDLDQKLRGRFPDQRIVLYGGRDSFIPHYSGTLETVELPGDLPISGTERRAGIEFPNTCEGRSALIHAARTRYPINYRTVDLAIIDPARDQVLMIGKNVHGGAVSFTGGYNDRKGETDLEAVLREQGEEIPGINISRPRLLGTLPINDPRYRRSHDGVVTTFFLAYYRGGEPKAADDADWVRWVTRSDLLKTVVPWHQGLVQMLLDSWPRPWYVRLFRFLFGKK